MKLIVEGTDLSGKSTAIEKIGKFYNKGFTLKNNFKPKNKQSSSEIYAHYWHIIKLITKEDFVILDRFFPSQAVYSYMRGTDEMGNIASIELDEFCKIDYIYIYLDTPLSELKRRYISRGDEHITMEDLRTIKERYDRFYKWTTMKKIKIYTNESDWFEKLQKFLKEVENEH